MTLNASTLKREFIAATSPDALGLSISLTEQCNFRCTYCYEDFEQGSMSETVYKRLAQLARVRIPELKHFELNWFGGEPLLEWKRMASYSRLCTALCEEYSVQMPPASVPTNAYGLTPEIMGELVSSGVGVFMISLDGFGDVHDRTRKMTSGKGTFARIYSNLLKLAHTDVPFNIMIRMHLHEENVASQLELACRLNQDFGGDARFSFAPVGLGNFGGPTIHALRLMDKNRAQNATDRIKAALPDRPPLIDRSMQVCCAAKPNRFFIRPDGNVYKCTSAGGRDDNRVGTLADDGDLAVDPKRIWTWSFGFETGVEEHLTCPLKHKSQVHQVRFVYRDRRIATKGPANAAR